MHFIYLCAIHLLKFIYLIIYKYRHTAINTTSASQKLPLAPPTHPPSLPHFHNLLPGHLVLFNRFPIFISGGAQLPRPPALPAPIPFTSTWAREPHPPPRGAGPTEGSLSPLPLPILSIGFPSHTHCDAEAAQHQQNYLEPKGHLRALSVTPFLLTAEWDFICSRVLVRGNGSSGGGQSRTPPGAQTLLSTTMLPLPSLPQTQLSQSQSLNVSTGHQDGPNTLGPLAVPFLHPTLAPSSHHPRSATCDMHGYVGGRKREHVWPVP